MRSTLVTADGTIGSIKTLSNVAATTGVSAPHVEMNASGTGIIGWVNEASSCINPMNAGKSCHKVATVMRPDGGEIETTAKTAETDWGDMNPANAPLVRDIAVTVAPQGRGSIVWS